MNLDLPESVESLLTSLGALFTAADLRNLAAGLMVLVLGWLAAWADSRGVRRFMAHRFKAQQRMLAGRATYATVLGLTLVVALRTADIVDLSVFLGAAGILTVALGFAAQTSTSNLISGLFLIGEKPFEVGDVVRIGTTTGTVLSIDLLSVKVRTFDNLFVRMPNETMLKSEIVNLTRFPIRRFDMLLGVAYKEDLDRVEKVLFETADNLPICLDEPRPLLIVLGFGESSVDLQFSVWGTSANYLELKNRMQRAVKAAFDAAGIEIPFPHRTLYAGSATAPLPLRWEGGAPGTPGASEEETSEGTGLEGP